MTIINKISNEEGKLFENIKNNVAILENLKKENPAEYKEKLSKLLESLKEYNVNAKNLIDFYKNNIIKK